MTNDETADLATINLAPYIQLAWTLVSLPRKVGGNQFRHGMATVTILIDYHYATVPVLLKAGVIHDVIEDCPDISEDEIRSRDSDGARVLEIVREVTRLKNHESRRGYLTRLRDNGSVEARILKVADRISNLTDLNTDIFSIEDARGYLDETEEFILPMAERHNADMARELRDLIRRKRAATGILIR